MSNVLEQVLAKGAAAIATAEASIRGLDGVFLRLVLEHRRAAALFKRIKSSEQSALRQEPWLELRVALLAHERAELQEVYAAFQVHPSLASVTNSHALHAGRLEELVAGLDALALTAPAWSTAFALLEAAFERHVQQEETQFFPAARAALGKMEAEKLEPLYVSAHAMLAESIRAVQRESL